MSNYVGKPDTDHVTGFYTDVEHLCVFADDTAVPYCSEEVARRSIAQCKEQGIEAHYEVKSVQLNIIRRW